MPCCQVSDMISTREFGQKFLHCLLHHVLSDSVRIFQSCSASGSTMVKAAGIIVFAAHPIGVPPTLSSKRSC